MSQSRPTQGGKDKLYKQKTKETQSGLKGILPQEGEPTGPENQENIRTVESLNFY